MGLDVKKQEPRLHTSSEAEVLSGFMRRVLGQLGVTVFRPSINNKNGGGRIVYPEADTLFRTRGEETVRMLEALTSMGVLRRTLLEVVKVCPNCGSASIEVREKCPSCGSETAVVYFAGVKPVCPSCGERFDGSQALLTCRSCKSSFTIQSCRDVPLYMYVLAGTPEEQRGFPGEQAGRGRGPEGLSLDMVKLVDAFAEKLDKVLEEYFKARPMYQVSQTTAVQQQGGVTQIQLAPHLAKTYQVVRNRGKVTALDVSIETGRSRPLESVYLNQLVALGLVLKQRVGRKLYFTIAKQ
ncbi:MAG: hypothetical protein RMJ28_07455 [Nitrososphaerota archaeon]|nr:hypothetical protein [Candidatus Calditenuaceae archaeon]MDW8074048.1 hypothetical protein [Nitrososphaerota archaeon]